MDNEEMKRYALFEEKSVRDNLLPLTFTRPVSSLRQGIDTLQQKWERMLPGEWTPLVCSDYLRELWPAPEGDDIVYVAANVIADAALVAAVEALTLGQGLVYDGRLLARRCAAAAFDATDVAGCTEWDGQVTAIDSLPDIFGDNGARIEADFVALTSGRESQPLSSTCILIGDPQRLFIEPGAMVEAAVINVTTGPVYVGREAEIAEGSTVRGPLALCDYSHINMGTKVYPGTTIGPWCKVGGELNNVVFQGYSNKAHDGFLGNAVIGEWCNLGADTVASNLKNDYSPVRLWNYPTQSFRKTQLQFCGLIMGDHSKAGINTMFNTATVVGVGCNIHGPGFPRTYVPSFSIGGAAGFDDVPLKRFVDAAQRMMGRRGKALSLAEERLYAELLRRRLENIPD